MLNQVMLKTYLWLWATTVLPKVIMDVRYVLLRRNFLLLCEGMNCVYCTLQSYLSSTAEANCVPIHPNFYLQPLTLFGILLSELYFTSAVWCCKYRQDVSVNNVHTYEYILCVCHHMEVSLTDILSCHPELLCVCACLCSYLCEGEST